MCRNEWARDLEEISMRSDLGIKGVCLYFNIVKVSKIDAPTGESKSSWWLAADAAEERHRKRRC
jgi:hypothetical protein